MDIVLNEKSIDGQFTEESFFEYMQDEVIPSLELINKNNCCIYKEYSTYSRKITADKDFASMLRVQGNPIINKLRIYLIQLCNDEPYWNDAIMTNNGIKYSCDIKETPNCITEAYERNGMVFSFHHDRFISTYLELWRDGIRCKVRNSYKQKILKEHLEELGIIEVWNKNSFYIGDTGYKFEIRFNEGHHNIAHFHVTNVNYSASISIPDGDVIVGKLPFDMEKRIVSWGLRNMSQIIELWNKEHPDKKVL